MLDVIGGQFCSYIVVVLVVGNFIRNRNHPSITDISALSNF